MPGSDFDLVNSDFHILMLRSMFQNQSLTRNGLLFHKNYVILLLTLNTNCFIVQNHVPVCNTYN